MAEPHEIPEAFGVWLLHGTIDSGTLELHRPARHVACKLPFPVWMALAAAVPVSPDGESTQRELGDRAAVGDAVADAEIDAQSHTATDT